MHLFNFSSQLADIAGKSVVNNQLSDAFLIKLVLTTLVIVVILLICHRFLKNGKVSSLLKNHTSNKASQVNIKVAEINRVSPNTTLYLIESDGECFLLSESRVGVNVSLQKLEQKLKTEENHCEL